MRVDAHVHVFPQTMARDRAGYARRDGTFRDLYASPQAKLATAEMLIESMEQSGIDAAVLVNIGWATQRVCAETNDYILASASKYPGRLIPMCTVNPRLGRQAVREIERCAALGARGVGELHPDPQGYDLADATIMTPVMEAAARHGLPVLVHASEPVGHAYAGKGTVTPQKLLAFIAAFPQATIICAHWGGGLPFYALMPEVRQALARVYFDTAASPFLYDGEIFSAAPKIVGAERVLFGTDFPLISHQRLLAQVAASKLTARAKAEILGGNAAKLFGLGGTRRGAS